MRPNLPVLLIAPGVALLLHAVADALATGTQPRWVLLGGLALVVLGALGVLLSPLDLTAPRGAWRIQAGAGAAVELAARTGILPEVGSLQHDLGLAAMVVVQVAAALLLVGLLRVLAGVRRHVLSLPVTPSVLTSSSPPVASRRAQAPAGTRGARAPPARVRPTAARG